MPKPEDRSPAWFDAVLVGLIAMTFVLAGGRVVLAAVTREPFSNELSLALAFALISAAILVAEVVYRIRQRRSAHR